MDSTINSHGTDRLNPATGGLPRPWDEFDVYLFDIDGTLINCQDAVHYFAFCSALKFLAGRELNLDGVVAHGNTDIGILRDALNLAGVSESQWRPQLKYACNTMCSFVDQNRANVCAQALPGVLNVLAHLRHRGAIIGVATGNLARIGAIKLERAGILDQFDFCAFSDGLEQRSEVYQRGVEQAHHLAGASSTICAIGDTPADIQAARNRSLSIIAVATGIHSLAELSASQPDLCLSSLEELAC
jgi:phosphoglycolate phosphatase